jgi:hypothetical protein
MYNNLIDIYNMFYINQILIMFFYQGIRMQRRKCFGKAFSYALRSS